MAGGMQLVDPRLPRAIRRAWLAVVAVGAAYVGVLAVEIATGAEAFPVGAHRAIQFALLGAGAALVLSRAIAQPEHRRAWLVLGLGLLVWMGGQLVSTLTTPIGESPAFPSALDAGLLAAYLAQYVTLFLLARAHLRRVARATWLDGAIAILLLGAVGAQWLLTPLLDHHGSLSGAIVTICYPAADLILLGIVVGVAALHGRRPGGVWVTLGVAISLTAAADFAFALGSAADPGSDVNVTTGPLGILYAIGALGLVAAAMRPHVQRPAASLEGLQRIGGPLAFCVVVVALLAYDAYGRLSRAADLLVAAAAVLLFVRGALAFRENAQLADSRRQALTDELTDLPNRRSAYLELDARCASGEPVGVLMIDLDRFKELNDTLGHLAGDDVLVAVAARIRAAVGEAGRLSRLGGDEFAVVLAPGAGEGEAVAVARRVLDVLDEPLAIDDLVLPVRASIGVATLADGSREELLRHADVAMYRAKSVGSGVEVYATERDGHSRERLALASELQDAISGSQLVLHFQPKACVRTGAIAGVEALVRWEHPSLGLVAPAEFVPLAERSGLGRLLTLEVIAQALRAQHDWRAQGLHVPVAVNTSAATLLDVRFPDDVAGLLERWDAPAGVLSLELTEDTIMTDPERAQDVLARLSELGIDLSLDDFGTGYSSLAMLKRLPVRELKIDRSFVTDMLGVPGDAAIVRSTVDLARNLGLRVVAEGVETPDAWERLGEWGCDLAQGFLISRPVPEGELLGLLRARV